MKSADRRLEREPRRPAWRRMLPSPVQTLVLFALWLILNRSISPGHVLVALIAALVIPWMTQGLRPPPVRLVRPGVILRYVPALVLDAARSSLVVASGVWRSRSRPLNPGFVRVPLELRDPTGLAWLAVVTNFVPGTFWCELAVDRSAVWIHVMDIQTDAKFIEHYKRLYEQPLREIFE